MPIRQPKKKTIFSADDGSGYENVRSSATMCLLGAPTAISNNQISYRFDILRDVKNKVLETRYGFTQNTYQIIFDFRLVEGYSRGCFHLIGWNDG